jgi:predicted TIM-barrel fold metal-dependent hydrolase
VLGKVAVEEHFVTPQLANTIFGSIGWDPAEWREMAAQLQDTGERRLADMDASGIEIAVLSLAAPCIQDEYEVTRAIECSRQANDALSEVVAAHPARYAGLAALPMQDPTAAGDELERCVTQLGFKGALVNGYSSVGNLETAAYYDEPAYLPFWERVAALDVPFYLHPRNPLPSQRRIYEGREVLLGPTWAFTMETASHCLRMMVSGLFDRFPTLQIVIGHMGELLPFAVARTEQRLSHIPSYAFERSPQDCLSENFYLTTSGNFHTPSLIGALLQVGADRLLFAADHPFERTVDAAAWFDHAPISEADQLKIGAANAKRLFKL